MEQRGRKNFQIKRGSFIAGPIDEQTTSLTSLTILQESCNSVYLDCSVLILLLSSLARLHGEGERSIAHSHIAGELHGQQAARR